MKNKTKNIKLTKNGVWHELPKEIETPRIGELIKITFTNIVYELRISDIKRSIDLINNVETIYIYTR